MAVPDRLTDPVVVRGLVQVAAATALAAVVVGISSLRNLDLERELGGSFVRGFVQVLAMGALIGALFSVPLSYSALLLGAMVCYAAWESRKRGDGVPNAFRISVLSLALGSTVVIVTMVAAGAIERTVRNLVPVGGMIIANAMKTNSLTLDRFQGEVASNREEIEAVLALGVPPERAISEFVTESVRASLIPVVDAMRTLGLVYIPGMMSGMILGGANPIYAAEYQFVIMGMIFAAGGLTSMTTSLLLARAAFTDAAQLRRFEPAETTLLGTLRAAVNR
ncbi:iron export ABC transporter permease subunit FetB [Haloplanus rallus]|uniref:Iron export ABC transporter permease subunit FetB n=1 Tax=Haloplanus rallus TaxID=1816183 RepID=A0A6B9FHV7_9EURY|nr:iron export ABC transporter permease subunit FetB [Haloplanus rallus]